MDFNLIATTDRGLERQGSSELTKFLKTLGDPSPRVSETGILGLLVAKTDLVARDVTRKVKKIHRKDPWSINYLKRMIPIDVVVKTELTRIVEAASSLADRIGEEDTFRVTVEKRRSRLVRADVVRAVAGTTNRKVDLTSPDWIILVEIIGRMTGVSVIRPGDTFNAHDVF